MENNSEEETEGSKMARGNRERCNLLSKEERQKYLELAFKLIYSGRQSGKTELQTYYANKYYEGKGKDVNL